MLGEPPTICLSKDYPVDWVIGDHGPNFVLDARASLRRTMQHEWTHWLQYQRLPRKAGQGPRSPKALRAHRHMGKPVGPQPTSAMLKHGYRQWQNITAEIEPIANELVRMLLDGRRAWQDTKFISFLAHGTEHPATKRLIKRIVLILQSLGREDLQKEFFNGLRQDMPKIQAWLQEKTRKAEFDRLMQQRYQPKHPLTPQQRVALDQRLQDLMGT